MSFITFKESILKQSLRFPRLESYTANYFVNMKKKFVLKI